MTVMSSIGNRRAGWRVVATRVRNGFSLIELLVVLTVIALGVAVVAPRIGHSLENSNLNGTLRSLLATARYARTEAVTQQREVMLYVDVDDRSYRLDDDHARPLRPVSAKIEVTGAESERRSDSLIGIRFFPDGSATGGRVAFTLDGQTRFVDVDWLTGLAVIEP